MVIFYGDKKKNKISLNDRIADIFSETLIVLLFFYMFILNSYGYLQCQITSPLIQSCAASIFFFNVTMYTCI